MVVNIKQSNKAYGRQVPIEYGSKSATGDDEYDTYNHVGAWVNASYGGSITVFLPEKAIISNWPKDLI